MAGSYGGETVGEEKLRRARDKTAGVNMEGETLITVGIGWAEVDFHGFRQNLHWSWRGKGSERGLTDQSNCGV